MMLDDRVESFVNAGYEVDTTYKPVGRCRHTVHVRKSRNDFWSGIDERRRDDPLRLEWCWSWRQPTPTRVRTFLTPLNVGFENAMRTVLGDMARKCRERAEVPVQKPHAKIRHGNTLVLDVGIVTMVHAVACYAPTLAVMDKAG